MVRERNVVILVRRPKMITMVLKTVNTIHPGNSVATVFVLLSVVVSLVVSLFGPRMGMDARKPSLEID